jgi:LacI family transcriptional regulator
VALIAEGATKRPTHRDIARLAGTSQATVSLVLNNRADEGRISSATRQSVLDAARKLGYTVDLGARRLGHRAGSAAAPELTLAILRPAGTPIGWLARLLDVTSESLALLTKSPQLVLEDYRPGRLAEFPGMRVALRFHGAIVTSPTPADEEFLESCDLPVPVVVFQRQLARQSSVALDNLAGGRIATEHLIRRGRRAIAAIGSGSIRSSALEQRLHGYRNAIGAAGLGRGERIALAPRLDEEGGYETAERLLREDRPDAIFAVSDVLAMGALSAVQRAGLRVPDDVALVGYDDLPFARFLFPALTTMRQPYDSMGHAAVAWLVDAVRNRAERPLREVFQAELVVRSST